MNSVAWDSAQHVNSQAVQARSGKHFVQEENHVPQKEDLVQEGTEKEGHRNVGREEFRSALTSWRVARGRRRPMYSGSFLIDSVLVPMLRYGSARCEHTTHDPTSGDV
jgi:hypothetical protein